MALEADAPSSGLTGRIASLAKFVVALMALAGALHAFWLQESDPICKLWAGFPLCTPANRPSPPTIVHVPSPPPTGPTQPDPRLVDKLHALQSQEAEATRVILEEKTQLTAALKAHDPKAPEIEKAIAQQDERRADYQRQITEIERAIQPARGP